MSGPSDPSYVLTAEKLADHTFLADDWRRTIGDIRRHGGPWPCRSCGGPSYLMYRCSKCGKDLASE